MNLANGAAFYLYVRARNRIAHTSLLVGYLTSNEGIPRTGQKLFWLLPMQNFLNSNCM